MDKGIQSFQFIFTGQQYFIMIKNIGDAHVMHLLFIVYSEFYTALTL